jgi:glycosyltransferase involved in cell wall biosynthesis
MKTIIDGRLILPKMTGIGRYLIGLSRGLRGLPGDDEFELWLQSNLSDDHPVWSSVGEQFKVRRLPVNHMALQQQWCIPLELNKGTYDLFHYPHFDLPFLVPGPVVVTLHDLKYISNPGFFPDLGRAKRLLMWLLMGFSVRRATTVIAVSNNTRKDIVRFYRVDPTKIVVIPEGVDDRYFSEPTPIEIQAVCRNYGLIRPFLFFVGERRPHKNILGLLKVFHHLRRTLSLVHHLVITGSKYADYDEPERLVETLGLSEVVHFIYCSDSDLPLMYRAADVFVSLSRYEGFGLPVLEAMASGIPVVAANCTSLPEVVGNAGILVNPDDTDEIAGAIIAVITGGKKRERMIEAGFKRAKAFSWSSCAVHTLAVYKKALSS